MKDYRQHSRVNKSVIVRFRIPQGYLRMSSRSEDICEDGIRLLLLQRLEAGMTLELNFSLEEYTEPITATGKIMWYCERKNIYFPFAIGVKFIKMQMSDRDRIRNYIYKTSQEADSSNIHRVRS